MQATGTLRERLFTMRMSNEEWERADRLARHYGLNLAGVLRMLMMDRERELGLAPAAPAPPSRPRPKGKR